MQEKMQSTLEAKQMQQGVWDLLLEVQVRATGDFREQGGLRDLLYWHDHPWKRCQVPLTFTSPNMCCSHQGKK